jgi:hypothetical protein
MTMASSPSFLLLGAGSNGATNAEDGTMQAMVVAGHDYSGATAAVTVAQVVNALLRAIRHFAAASWFGHLAKLLPIRPWVAIETVQDLGGEQGREHAKSWGVLISLG